MLGAIAGDIVGSVYEWHNIKTKGFQLFSPGSRFTDDTVLTVALADSILHGVDYAENLRLFYARYPNSGYGSAFSAWAERPGAPAYKSWGNGSAMRVSPVGFAYDELDRVLAKAAESASCTHNHPEGIKGAQATAAAIFLARQRKGKDEIRDYVESTFEYDLGRSVDEIRPEYRFDVSCQGSVPQAILAFIDSDSFEDCLRTAVSLGGDSDTIACIAGGIAQAYYGGVPDLIAEKAYAILDPALAEITRAFMKRFC